ncbi:hypothetical protein GCK32_022214, partial [Trichostrongylus colubriformis]
DHNTREVGWYNEVNFMGQLVRSVFKFRSWATREYVRKVNLIVIDEIHLLGVDRGAVLEAIITRQ